MEPLYYVIAILGCGDGGDQCRQERVEPVRYASAAQCQAAMPAALTRHTDLFYPVVSAACQRSGDQMASARTARPGS
jgi:hypothetical protein